MAELSRAGYCDAQRPDPPRSRGEVMERVPGSVRVDFAGRWDRTDYRSDEARGT